MEKLLDEWSFLLPLASTVYAVIPLITGRVANRANLFDNADQSGLEVNFTRARRPIYYWTYVVIRIAFAIGVWIAWGMWKNEVAFTQWALFGPVA